MRIGFTGTREGMTQKQRHAIRFLLTTMRPVEVHHGDCVGADEQFHGLARDEGIRGERGRVVIHPPSSERKRAFCRGDYHHPPRPYLHRNEDIVDACDLLIAAPAQGQEVKRSGTWSTVRYARKVGKEIRIVYPSGEVVTEARRIESVEVAPFVLIGHKEEETS